MNSSPAQLRRHCTLLLSALAHAGQHTEAERLAAFERGRALAPLGRLGDLLPAAEASPAAVDAAVDALAGTNRAFRDSLLGALAATSGPDGATPAAALFTRIEAALGGPPTPPPAPSGPVFIPAHRPVAAEGGALPPVSWSELDRLPALALVAANLVPLAGVLFFGWDARNLLLLYWLENLVVGGYTLLRMLHASGLKAAGTGLFFSFHYGFFCAGHGMFVLAISSMGADFDDGWAVMDDANFGPLLPFVMLKGLLGWIAVHTPELLFIPLIGFVISHGVSTVMHHFIGGEDEGRAADDIMMDPYKRIFALHVAIIVGSFFVIQAGGGSAAPVLIVLVLLKTGIDLYQHRRAHRARAEAQPKLMRASRSTEESA